MQAFKPVPPDLVQLCSCSSQMTGGATGTNSTRKRTAPAEAKAAASAAAASAARKKGKTGVYVKSKQLHCGRQPQA